MTNTIALATALAAALAAKQPGLDRATPQSTTTTNGTVALVVLDARESHQKGRHVVAAISTAGDVAGAILTPRGKTYCEFTGRYDFVERCLVVSGCGAVDATSCP